MSFRDRAAIAGIGETEYLRGARLGASAMTHTIRDFYLPYGAVRQLRHDLPVEVAMVTVSKTVAVPFFRLRQ